MLAGYERRTRCRAIADADERARCARCSRGAPPPAVRGADGLRRSPRPSSTRPSPSCARRSATPRTATTTFGYGPRFLHSTGQFHKGGPRTGRFLQLLARRARRRRDPGRALHVHHAQERPGDRRPADAARARAARPSACAWQGDDPAGALRALTTTTIKEMHRDCRSASSGSGKMGGNMVAPHPPRLRPRGGRVRLRREGGQAGGRRTARPARGSLKELVKQLEPPRIVWIMVPAGDADPGDGRQARQAARPRRHDRRRRQLAAGPTTSAAPGAASAAASTTSTSASRGGVWGLEVGYCMMVGGPAQGGQAARADPRRARARDQRAEPRGDRPARLAALRPRRRRALREDGPQRRRVRPDAGLRRGLRRCSTSASTSSTTPRSRTSGARARWCARGCANWPPARSRPTATTSRRSRATPRTPARAAGRSQDATAHDVPTPVITRLAVRAPALARQRRLRRPRAGRAAQPVRRPRGQERRPTRGREQAPSTGRAEPSSEALTMAVAAGQPPAEPENPLTAGLERLPVAPDDARHLRRHRRPRQAQTAARALQPRPRGRAARALPPGRRLARREGARGLPRRVRARRSAHFSRRTPDEDVLQGAARERQATCRARSTTRRSTRELREGARRLRRARPASR